MYLVCELNEPINSMNVQELVSCFEIDGNIVILNHVFDEHIPDIPVMGTQ